MIVSLLRLAKRLYELAAGDKYFLNQAKRRGLVIGKNCRIMTKSLGGEPYLVTIGDHVTLSKDVEIITHDGGAWVFRDQYPALEIFGKVEIGNNVFIGAHSIILPGTKVEDNVVVGAGAVIRGNLPSGWVYAGVPAHPICSLEDYLEKCLCKGQHTKNEA